MASTVNISLCTKSMGGERRGNVNDTSPPTQLEPSPLTSQPTSYEKIKETILHREEAFIYGNVAVEGREEDEDPN